MSDSNPVNLSADERECLWDAINAYAQACGGDTSAATAYRVERQAAVAEIERLVRLLCWFKVREARP